MFELPLIRIDEKKYLELLQDGQFFMRNSLYYQRLDSSDLARFDPFDGSIPATKSNPFPLYKMPEIKNTRIMFLNSFIKCFIHYKVENQIKINDNVYALVLPKNTRESMKEFSSKYALIIIDTNRFIKQVEVACRDKSISLGYSDLKYLNIEDMQEQETLFLLGKDLTHPCFIKNKQYIGQQEFRFCVNIPFEKCDSNVINIGSKMVEQTYTLNIGKIDDISDIVPVSILLKYPVIIDLNKKAVGYSTNITNEMFDE